MESEKEIQKLKLKKNLRAMSFCLEKRWKTIWN